MANKFPAASTHTVYTPSNETALQAQELIRWM